jgi:uncharacterized protein (TIGR03067 family)
MRVRWLFILAAGLLVAADSTDEAAQKELKKLKGTWVMVSGEVDGKAVADEHVKKSKITWDGGKVTLITPHQSDKPIEGTTRLDPTKTPKEMDFTRSVGPSAKTTMHAIYEFDGDDKYRICFDPSGTARPKEFATKEGTGHVLHVWKRQKD